MVIARMGTRCKSQMPISLYTIIRRRSINVKKTFARQGKLVACSYDLMGKVPGWPFSPHKTFGCGADPQVLGPIREMGRCLTEQGKSGVRCEARVMFQAGF